MSGTLSKEGFSSCWLVLVFFLRAVSAHSTVAASCKSDSLLYCQNMSGARLEGCLVAEWRHISRPCRASLAESAQDPCSEVVREHCLDKAALNRCIEANLSHASPACRKKQESGPCFASKQRFCKSAQPGKERIACLLNHAESLPMKCMTWLQSSSDWIRPCGDDVQRFCRGEVDAVQRACLWAKKDQLAPLCRKLVQRKRICDKDAAVLCKGVPAPNKVPCLLKQKARLSRPCLENLKDIPPSSLESETADDEPE